MIIKVILKIFMKIEELKGKEKNSVYLNFEKVYKEVLESIGDEYYNPGKICVVPTEVLQKL